MKYLVVVDMQNDFITGSLGTKEAEAILPRVADKIKNFDGTVIFTKDTHTADYLSTQEGRNLPVEHCIINTWGWELPEELKPLSKAQRVFNKPTFGSLELTEFLMRENEKEAIEAIELCGLCTDICVLSNAVLIKAGLTEVPISVDASCCAGVTPKSHLNAIEAMKMCQIKIVNG